MLDKSWFALRIKYVHAERISCQLNALYPYVQTCFIPPVSGLLFALTTRDVLDDFIHCRADGKYVGFIWDKATKNPLVVREKAMDDFIRVCGVMQYPIVMTERPQVTLGSHVRVIDGPLKGVEGRVVRMKKSRRILVDVEGVLWAATEFIGPDLLEVIEDEPAS